MRASEPCLFVFFCRETHLVSEFDTIELVGGLQQLRPEGGGDELGVARQLHNHVCNEQESVTVRDAGRHHEAR